MFVSNEWDRAAEGRTIYVAPLDEAVLADVVHFKDRETDSYGDYLQGEDEVYIIFKVGDRFYKKIGHKSSYGYGTTWTGPVTEVIPQEKTVTEYVMQPVTKTVQVFE